MGKKRLKNAMTIAGACTGLAMVLPVLAQTNNPAAGKQAGGLEEVIVTAQKRAENLQDVSVSASALSGDMLKDKSVTRLDELQFAVPGLSITDAGLTQSVNIRGVGLASGSPNASNGVATYVDGVFQPPIVSSTSFYDIASVEVFRGPQGTFVGSNSTGGAIFINSENPDLDGVGGYVEGTYGRYDYTGLQGAVNVPVSDSVALRAALNYRNRDSFYQDIGPANSDAGSLDETAFRIGALWKPVDQFQALLKVERADKETGGYAYRPIQGTAYGANRSDNIRTLNYSDDTQNDEQSAQNTLELNYELNGGIIIRSVSGYQNKQIDNLYDTDATNDQTLARSTQDQFVRERLWTQEINIISPTDGDLSWIVGAYFQRNKIDVIIANHSDGFPVNIELNNKKTTTGLFGQMTYAFNAELEIDLGVRFSDYEVEGTGGVFIGRGIPSFPSNGRRIEAGGEHSDDGTTGKIALNWTPNDNDLVYAFVAQGYKAGGYASPTVEFDPETVTDYEFGWKSTLADGRVRTQLGAYYYDYKDFQFEFLEPSTGRSNLANLSDATVKGIELQVQAQFNGLGIDAGVAYNDSELSGATFVDEGAYSLANPGASFFPQCTGGDTPGGGACSDYSGFLRTTSGGPNLFAPELTYNMGLEYQFLVGQISITPRINYAYVGEQWTNILYTPERYLLAARGLLSAQATVEMESVTVQVYGTNLADKDYISGQSGDNEFYGAPREVGVRVRFDF